jgi:aldehyde:ferredoxin oxidoreductase
MPGATPIHWRQRPAADPYFEHNEVVFRVGPAPEAEVVESGRTAA